MSKNKTDIILKKYKDNYLCKLGHSISWQGKDYIHLDVKCNKCGKDGNNSNPIRWGCSQCKQYFCCCCYELIIDKCCPKQHKYKYSKQNIVSFFVSYTCDCCHGKFETKDGVLYDSDCDVTICVKCFCDSCDIPDSIED